MLFRVVQLTDVHLGGEGATTFDVNGRQRFLDVLEEIVKLSPDTIWLTGDLCLDDPDPEIYPWVKSKLDALQIPYYVIAGNHDDSITLAKTFHPTHLNNRELYYSKRLGGHFIVFLDTARGRLTNVQWDWFEKEIDNLSETLHIVMHHPPVYAGVPHMDNRHAFIEQERFIDLMECRDHPIHIYCGHYHTARYLRTGNMHIHIAPSTLFQINPYQHEFAMESTQGGIQIIDLDEDRVAASIRWLINLES